MKRRIVALILIVAVFVCLAILLPKYVSLDVLIQHESEVRTQISTHPLQSWLIGALIYFAVSLIPGTSGKSVICGWIFGFWLGLLMVDLALTAAALVMYSAGRSVLRDLVSSRFPRFLERLNRHLEYDGPFYLLMLRLAHVPFTLVNYSSGAVGVRFRTFWWTTLCGLLPGTAVFVFAGTQLPTLREIKERGILGLLDPGLIAALIATALLPIAVRILRQRN